jgi:hypothetical protein
MKSFCLGLTDLSCEMSCHQAALLHLCNYSIAIAHNSNAVAIVWFDNVKVLQISSCALLL